MSKRDQLEGMLQADPDDVFVRYALAMACRSEGDLSSALACLDEVLQRDPNYVAAHFQKGQILAEQGETEPAQEAITRGIEAARQVGDDHAEREMTEFLEAL